MTPLFFKKKETKVPRSRKMSVLRCRFCDRNRNQPPSSTGEKKQAARDTSEHLTEKCSDQHLVFSKRHRTKTGACTTKKMTKKDFACLIDVIMKSERS